MSLHIIIPVYNTENYIQRCFDSLIVEDLHYIKTYSISVLFVNDGSTDGSQDVIDNLKEKYDFVDSIYQDNQGLSVARNTGIININSRYYSLLDSDDWLDMSKFCIAYEKMLKQKLDIISYGLSYYDENEEFTGHRPPQSVEFDKIYSGIEFLKQGYQPSSACLFIYNRDFILDNNLWYYPGITQEDVEHTFRMMIKVKGGLFLDIKVYNYYRRSDSDTMTKSKERIQKYLKDSVEVAHLVSKNIKDENVYKNKDLITLTQKTYNSVVWNLIWRFVSKPDEMDKSFKMRSLKELKSKNLYPIKGPLKTRFQHWSRILMNFECVLNLAFKR